MLRLSVIALLALATAAAPPSHAKTHPVIVIPSRPGIPVVINGRVRRMQWWKAATGSRRPGTGSTVIGGSPVVPSVYTRRNSYHPRYGAAPERRRHGIEP